MRHRPRILIFCSIWRSHIKSLATGRRPIRYYKELLQVAPTHVQGNFNLAYAYRDGASKHDWSRATVLYKKVLELDSDYTEAIFHLATLYWKLGNETEARRHDQLYLQ